MKITLTGATGFIGSHVLTALQEQALAAPRRQRGVQPEGL